MVWLNNTQYQLSDSKSVEYSESYGQKCVDVFYIDSVKMHNINSFKISNT